MLIFGPWINLLRFTAYVRACDVHPYAKRLGEEGHSVCAHYAQKNWMVDPFHVKNHVEKKCLLLDPACQYHPRHAKHIKLSQSVNLEVNFCTAQN